MVNSSQMERDGSLGIRKESRLVVTYILVVHHLCDEAWSSRTIIELVLPKIYILNTLRRWWFI